MPKAATVRDRLLLVARELFSRKGFEETSVREITSRARANLGAITYYFGSKEALYLAAIESVTEPLVEAVTLAARQRGAPLERLEAIVRGVLEHLARNPAAPRVLLRELAGDQPIPAPMAQAMKRNLATLASTIEAGQKEGTIRDGDPVFLALSVVAQPFFITVAGRLIREVVPADRNDAVLRARVVEHVVQSVRRLLANHPEANS